MSSVFDEILTKVVSHFSNSEQANGVFKLVMELLNKPEIGGISGLMKTFEEKGLGGIISSWIGTGENLPISAEQIKQVLGGGELEKISSETSLPVDNLSSDLAVLLPKVIDLLTPNGQVADSHSLLELGMDFLKGKLAGDSEKTA
jgi:uncharacterized protein YidB (DUF937 family)